MMKLFSISTMLFFIWSFSVCQGSAQKEMESHQKVDLLDSLQKKLKYAPDSTQVDLLNKLAYNSYYIQPRMTYEYAQQAVILARRTGYNKGLAEAQRMMGIGLLLQNKFRESMEWLYKGLKTAKSIEFYQGIADNYNSIGVLHSTIHDSQKAIVFFRKSVTYQIRAGNKLREAIVTSNIGDIFLDLSEKDSSRIYIEKAHNMLLALHNKTWLSMTMVRLARVQKNNGDQGKAIKTLQNAIQLAKETDQNIFLRNALHEISSLHFENDAYEKADVFNTEAIEVDKTLGFIPFLTESYELRYKIQKALKKYQQALTTLSIYSNYKDSLYIQQDKFNLDYLGFKYELEQKKRDFLLLKAEKEAQEMAALTKMQKQNILVIAISVFLLIVGLSSYVLHKLRKKEIVANKQLKSNNEELALQKKELSASLQMVKDLNAQLHAYNDSMNHLAIVFITDSKGNIMFVNDNFCKITGYSKEDVIGKNSIFLKSDVHSRKFFRRVIDSLKKGKTWRGEICSITKTGKQFWVDTAIAPVMGENGQPQQFFTLQFEITYRKKHEEQLEYQKEELTKLNQLKDQMFSIVSHDFRSPLNSLKGALSLYTQGIVSHEDMKSMAAGLTEKLNTTSSMLDNLLNWAKNQLQGIQIKPEIFNLCELANENIELIRPMAEKKQILIRCDFDETLKVFADKEMIKLVLRNLISNAVKFSEKGDRVWMKVYEKGDQMIISVNDQGMGMSEEQVKNIFTSSASSTLGTANEKGMGLGLILCKEFIEKNGGTIWLESEEGKGSSFQFSLLKNQKNMIDTSF